MKQHAHYHPNLDDPCAHDAPRWQDIPNGWYVNTGRLPTWLVIAVDAIFLGFGFIMILLVVEAFAA